MKLYPFQQEGVAYALAHKYSINACEMGLGKTAQAIAVAESVKGWVLIVCPAYLKQNWSDELDKWGANYARYTVMSYGELTKAKPEQYAAIIMDEAHYLKNMEAKRTKAAHRWVKSHRPEYLLLLTGTPVLNRVCEFYSLMKLCSYNPAGTSGKPLTKSFENFASNLSYEKTFTLGNGVQVKKYEGLKNKPLLIEYLKGKYFRRTAAQELDLPKVTYNRVSCGHISVGNELLDQFQSGAKCLSTAKADLALLKAKPTAKYLLELLSQDIAPVLVYSDHVESAKYIAEYLQGKRIVSRVITGATPSTKRTQLVNDFQFGNIEVLVATIGSLSTGFTLTRSNRIVFNDTGWVPGDILQAEARIVRISQERPCFVTHMVASGIDTLIRDALQKKMEVLRDTL